MTMSPSNSGQIRPHERGLRRWWIYQRERFPLHRHGPLILAFSCSAVTFSWMLRSQSGWPAWSSLVVAFLSCLIFFIQMRIADEFKDDEDDTRYRPYRPVPRGLVTLRELGVIFVSVGVVQLCLAFWLDVRLLVPLFITWTYLALMSKEFFASKWLRSSPLLYMLTHVPIIPIIDLYATSTDWLVYQGYASSGLIWFLLTTLFNGMVIEIGRKIRSPQDEEEGVVTYSAVWGRKRAVCIWWLVLGLTLAFALMAASRVSFVLPCAIALGIAFTCAVLIGIRFLRQQAPRGGQWIENWSGAWTLVLYVIMGLAPLLWRELG